MSDFVAYKLEHPICTITLDHGKVNCLSPQMLAEVNAAGVSADLSSGRIVASSQKEWRLAV